MSTQVENITKNVEIILKRTKQELKSTKITQRGSSENMDCYEERISEIGNWSVEIIPSEEQK